ncbi:MAG TPA: LptF/LptG family permease [Vicinamibacterales bacterium]|nr:LptF/LptG family permease [Vicinamibacterales bacterium]
MFRLLDRYLVRQILLPFLLVLVGLTFALEIPPILQTGEKFIAKGVQWRIIVEVLLTLLPQALGVTIPMALLLAILIGLGRLSADREIVALQACGVSVFRILRPLGIAALLATAATAYVMIVALPNANQTYRVITFNIVASSAEGDVKPRVFFQQFPNRVVYVREIPVAGGWRDVFIADTSQPDRRDVYFAKQGRLIIDRGKQTVQLLLENGTQHTTNPQKPDDYTGTTFEHLTLDINWEDVFPRTQIMKGDPEKTIAELRATAAENAAHHLSTANQFFMIQQKFSLPAACLILAIIGVALGVTTRKEGMLGGFVFGIGVLFTYYVLLYAARGLALGGRISPSLAPWLPNVILGVAGVALVIWRAGSGDQPIRISLPWPRSAAPAGGAASESTSARRRGVVLVIRVPNMDWARPSLLDLYIMRRYAVVWGLAFVSLVGVFYISTFIDLAPHLYRGAATTAMLLRYYYWVTPKYVYFIIPLSVLVATLVTVGLLTKNSELIVMRACGISLYRSAVPLVLLGALFSVTLFGLEEYVLPSSNVEEQRMNAAIRGFQTQTVDLLNRRWVVGSGGDIYHYDYFDPRRGQFSRFSLFRPTKGAWNLASLTYANTVTLTQPEARGTNWTARAGWQRDFTTTTHGGASRTSVAYEQFTERPLALESPSFFSSEEPDAERMTYGQLRDYVMVLRSSGYQVVPYVVQLQRKLAFPFVAIIMTLLALPFAVSMGRHGAMFGIGAGLVLALVYWTMLSVFGAIGAGGWISPVLAAWAPNILFGAAAVYLLLTVRT